MYKPRTNNYVYVFFPMFFILVKAQFSDFFRLMIYMDLILGLVKINGFQDQKFMWIDSLPPPPDNIDRDAAATRVILPLIRLHRNLPRRIQWWSVHGAGTHELAIYIFGWIYVATIFPSL